MKNTLLILFLIFSASRNYAQDIILTFNGVIGDPSLNAPLEKVVIENTTQGEINEITGSYVYNLTTGTVLAIENFEKGLTKKGFQNVYPNPFVSTLNLEFYSEGVGLTQMNIYNELGQEIISFSKELGKGIHGFKFSPNKDGLYFIQLRDNGSSFYSKVFSSQNSNSVETLSYSINSMSMDIASNNNSNKGANKSSLKFSDNYSYTGYYGVQKSTISEVTTESKTITFNFSEQAESIVGIWSLTSEFTDCGGSLTLSFSSTKKATYNYGDTSCNNVEDYIVQGNTLYLSYDGQTHQVEITELTSTTLTLKEVDGSEIFIETYTRQ